MHSVDGGASDATVREQTDSPSSRRAEDVLLAETAIKIVMRERDVGAGTAASIIRLQAVRHELTIAELTETIVKLSRARRRGLVVVR